jgi:predicted PurR-regulated permease PerM
MARGEDPSELGRARGVPRDLTQTTLAVLFIVGLIAASLWIVRPFLGSAVWATMIVVATWPLMLRVQGWLGNRRPLAVAAMVGLLVLVYVVPFALAIGTVLDNADRIAGWATALATLRLPPPPEVVHALPLVGARIARAWERVAAAGVDDLGVRLEPHARAMALWLIGRLGGLGVMTLEFALTTIIAALMYAHGETAASGVLRFARRLAGARGEHSVRLAAQAIRSVALGVVLTALIQAILGGLGLAVAGVPFAVLLTAVMFMLTLAQLGPLAVLLPAVVWLYWRGSSGWGTALLAWTIAVTPLDNFLRPILIRRGLDLPLVLIFAGVIGGLIGFGLVGIFVGPVVLAVGHALLKAWVVDATPSAAEAE